MQGECNHILGTASNSFILHVSSGLLLRAEPHTHALRRWRRSWHLHHQWRWNPICSRRWPSILLRVTNSSWFYWDCLGVKRSGRENPADPKQTRSSCFYLTWVQVHHWTLTTGKTMANTGHPATWPPAIADTANRLTSSYLLPDWASSKAISPLLQAATINHPE